MTDPVVMWDENLAEKVETMQSQSKSRTHPTLVQKTSLCRISTSFSKALTLFLYHILLTYCKNCKVLKTDRLLPNYFKQPAVKFSKNFTCTNKVYINPSPDKFPDVLKGLSLSEIIVLRTFNIYIGNFVKKQNGYKQKTNLFRLTWTEQSVLEINQSIDDAQSKNSCVTAYKFLMAHEQSAYAKFASLKETSFQESKKFNEYDFTQNVGVECAL